MKNSQLKSILIDRDGPFCYECNFHAGYPSVTQLDLHHGLIHDQKRFHDALTNEINCVLICRDCHPFTNGHEFRVKVLRDKVEVLGLDRMRTWWDSLPDKLKRGSDYAWIEEALK